MKTTEEKKRGLVQQDMLQNFAISRTHGPIEITLAPLWVSDPKVGNH